ncbi:DUF3857 domain-containing protein [Winogradskyella sp.]|uniref:DUF3857 domain-containing protein n=1 Tax=Winogradskyella sp. TaxID=1883156 RepID=UPI002623867E|nr:DUF3857 domain-containing protein [Winogradskyella sp.]
MRSIKIFQFVALIFICFFGSSQSEDAYIALTVPVELKINANAVVRYDSQVIEINDFNDMVVFTKRIVTVYNKYGDKHINAVEFYDENTNIKDLEIKIYNKLGNQIKRIKKNEFSDQSAVSGGTLYSDSRVKFYEYKPIDYPYTIEFVSEVKYRSTAFVPQWRPISGYYLGVQYSEYKIINNSDIEIRKKLSPRHFNIEENTEDYYQIKNTPGIKYETFSPSLSEITPLLKVALTSFNMEGVPGINNNWQDFGKWMHDKLLVGTDDLPQDVIDEVKALTNGVDDKIERAKIVYNYLQDKTRYISVQIGIGGWKPIAAEEVDRLGYGDCKGLSNYTKALLEVVDVPSYYTVVYGSDDIKSLDSSFSVTEGNHVILCIPTEDENIFLECTSQSNPFGFTAGFTDDRAVLLVKPDGGEIVHTKTYNADDSVQNTYATVDLDETGSFSADVSISTTGYQYHLHEGIQNETTRDQQMYYKDYWSHINNLSIEAIDIENDKDAIVFNEKVKLSTENYASKSGPRLILQPNIFNRVTKIPQRYSDRQLDFKIDRSFKDTDEFIITFPSSLKIEAMGEGETLNTEFGSYMYKLEKIEDNKIKYTRTYVLNKGNYTKSDYKVFRDFMKSIVKYDKTKIVLVKSN